MANLVWSELSKRDWAIAKFIQKINDGEPFELANTGVKVVIGINPAAESLDGGINLTD